MGKECLVKASYRRVLLDQPLPQGLRTVIPLLELVLHSGLSRGTRAPQAHSP